MQSSSLFDILPSLQYLIRLLYKKELKDGIKSVWNEMNVLAAERKVQKAPKNLPHVSDRNYRFCEDVFVTQGQGTEYIGRFLVVHTEGPIVRVRRQHIPFANCWMPSNLNIYINSTSRVLQHQILQEGCIFLT